MIESTIGVILRTQRLTESSLIVRWLTRDWGRLATVAKGARRPKSPFAGKLDLLYEAELTFSRSRSSQLHALREVQLKQPHPVLREDLGRLTLAAYAVRAIEQTTEEDTPLPEVFNLMTGLLAHLDAHPARPRLVFAFELKLLHELGLSPDLASARLSSEGARLASKLANDDWVQLEELSPAAASVKQLNAFLHGFLIHHLGRLPPGRSAALGRPGV
jgi:DNA repair protein RecO (recombination protein O)